MIIYFRVRVDTLPGEEVYITGSSPILGKYYPDNAFKMKAAGKNAKGETVWEARLQFDSLKERVLRYKYFVKRTDGTLRYEVGGGRRVALNSATVRIESIDHWQEYTEEAPFLTDPFAHVFYGTNYSPYTQTHKRTHELIIRAVVPNVPRDCRIVLCGEGKDLGNWKPEDGVKMARLKGLKWIASFSTEGCKGQKWNYRLAMINDKTGMAVFEELAAGTERQVEIPEIKKNETVIIEHSQVKFPPLQKKFAGCCVPLFSLRNENPDGCGTVNTLKSLVDWAQKTGMRVLEIMPVNDTTQSFTGRDSSPYKSISSLGINPVYVSLNSLGTLSDSRKAKDASREMKSLSRRATVDWEDLYAFKMKYLEDLFVQNGKTDEAHPDFYKFMNEHKDWLCGYALFCSLRDFYRTADFSRWGEFRTYSEDIAVAFGGKVLSKTYAAAHPVLSRFSLEDIQRIHFRTQLYIWIQYHLFRQLSEAISYAHSKGIALKGELQMRVVPHSVDCWKFPHLFSGVDKDGFAAFNWEGLAKENFMWWKKRIRVMSLYLDIFSIPTVVGLCDEKDRPVYEKMIPQIVAASNMMVWGDGWESLRILPQFIAEKGQEEPYYLSTIYTSSSDGRTMRTWLGEKLRTISFKSEDKKKTYFDSTKEECLEEMKKALGKDSMFAMVTFQDWLSLDSKTRTRFPYSERINDPEDKDHVWKYRCPITIESLIKSDSLNNLVYQLISGSNRLG